jgi:hypothetical protein
MTAVTPIISQKGSWIYSGAERIYLIPFEAHDVNPNDTITIPGVTTIKDAMLVKKSDQAQCTWTKATHILTVTESPLGAIDLVGAVLAVL